MKRFLSALIVAAVCLFAFNQVEAALVAHYDMSYAAGSVGGVVYNPHYYLLDASGNGNLMGSIPYLYPTPWDYVTDVAGPFGNALQFPGGGKGYRVYSNSALNITGTEFTMGIWMKVPSSGVTWGKICGTFGGGGYAFFGGSQVTIYGGGLPWWTTPSIADNTWHYIAFTLVGGVGTLYLDAVPVAGPQGGISMTGPGYDFELMGNIGYSLFTGGPTVIDELKIYNHGLSADDIAQEYLDYLGSPSEILDMLNSLEAEIDALEAERDALQAQVNQLTTDLSVANGTIAAQTATISLLNSQISALQTQINGLNTQIAGLNAQVAQLTADLSAANATIASQAGTISTLLADLAAANQTIGQLQAQIVILQAQVDAALEGLPVIARLISLPYGQRDDSGKVDGTNAVGALINDIIDMLNKPFGQVNSQKNQ